MNDDRDSLLSAARVLVETESLLGGRFIPAGRNPLPTPQASARLPAAQAPAARSTGRGDKAPQPASASAAPKKSAPAAGNNAAALEALDVDEVRNCTACVLYKKRTQTVFGEGDPNARLVFIGEGPGADEDAQGRPFVGRAGQKLTEMIEAMGLTREQVYICNVVKCRPPGNRTPMPDEVQACWSYLIRQLEIIRPDVIVTMGNPATQNLLNTRVGITKLRGTWQELPESLGETLAGTPVMPIFHPSYLLRQYTLENRRHVWHDLQAVMKKLGLK